ncbi:MAG TPA: ATP-binding protein [Thermoanaerobaculia bacterium]|jgi:PAS domain S-box-containing protein|nr:ATP-binding protein [Thermoanaerobaculia bacterium]
MRESHPHILLLDDQADDRALARLVIAHEMPQLAIEEITDAPAFAQACGRRSFDLVILEQKLQWADGLAILAVLKEDWPEVPVILFTRLGSGAGPEDFVLRAVRLGVDEVLGKTPAGFLRLPLTVRSALDRRQLRTAAAAARPEGLLAPAQMAVFSATPEGRLLNASPGFLSILGVRSLEDAARLDLVPLIAAATRGPGAGTGAMTEVRLQRADGRTLWVEVMGTLVRGAEGVRVDGLVEDVTARKEAEGELARQSAQLRRATENPEDVQQFATMASHELQEPVRMMERYTQLLREDFEGKLGPSGDELIAVVAGAARRLRTLIDDLLSFSRFEGREQRSEKVGAEALLAEALSHLAAAIEESGAMVTHSSLPEIEADPFLIVQLFHNLIANAVKFRGPEAPRIHVAARREGREWVFSVRDNGIGLDPAEAESIFTMFRRLHPEIPGSGIGLALCRKIVERHGGRIWAEGAPGGGATFSFTLPASVGPAIAKAQ